MIVLPSDFPRLMIFQAYRREPTSIPEVGSSSMTTLVVEVKARAIDSCEGRGALETSWLAAA